MVDMPSTERNCAWTALVHVLASQCTKLPCVWTAATCLALFCDTILPALREADSEGFSTFLRNAEVCDIESYRKKFSKETEDADAGDNEFQVRWETRSGAEAVQGGVSSSPIHPTFRRLLRGSLAYAPTFTSPSAAGG